MENNEKVLRGIPITSSFPIVIGKRSTYVKKGKSIGILPYIMVAPSTVVFLLFILYPILYMMYLSLFDWNLIGPKKFVFAQNFIELFGNSDFWQVMNNSFQYMFLTVTLSIVLALPLAVYLNRKDKIGSILQSIVFSPYIVSLISVAFIWMWLMDSDYGLLNYIINLFGIPSINWMGDPKIAMLSLVLVSVWKVVGYNTIILLSSMQTIPQYLYEAANLDGAKKTTVFLKITLPMISPTLFFIILMNMISSFKVFETVNVMTQGGPMNSTNTLVHDIYQYAFQFYKIGYASAIGVVLMVIIAICTLLYFLLLSKRVYYR